MRGPRACGWLLVASVLLPSLAWADPEIWLVIGAIVPPNGSVDTAPSSDAFRPEAGAIALREGDVVPMSTCDALLNLGLRSSAGASTREQILVRLQKKRTASGCALEVLKIGRSQRRGDGTDVSTPRTSGTTTLPSTDDLGRIDARDLPCGTQLIVVREGRTGGSSGSVDGRGRSGDCHESADDMHSPLGISWLNPPPASVRTR